MAKTYVCSGAKLMCTCGDCISELTVFPTRQVFLCGHPKANISDHISLKNIGSFGKCYTTAYPPTGTATSNNHGRLTPMPCIPNTVFKWMFGKDDNILRGEPALLSSSKCKCVYGGIITIVHDGQHPEEYDSGLFESLLNKDYLLVEVEKPDQPGWLKGISYIPIVGSLVDLIWYGWPIPKTDWIMTGLSLIFLVIDIAGLFLSGGTVTIASTAARIGIKAGARRLLIKKVGVELAKGTAVKATVGKGSEEITSTISKNITKHISHND